jgi:hypothetical protein
MVKRQQQQTYTKTINQYWEVENRKLKRERRAPTKPRKKTGVKSSGTQHWLTYAINKWLTDI